MCSPVAIIFSRDLKALAQSEPFASGKIKVPAAPISLRQRMPDWVQGLKQTFIAELASLGMPKEQF